MQTYDKNSELHVMQLDIITPIPVAVVAGVHDLIDVWTQAKDFCIQTCNTIIIHHVATQIHKLGKCVYITLFGLYCMLLNSVLVLLADDSISSKRDDTNDKAVLANGGQEERETQDDRVEAEGERFYSVDDDLKKLFSSTDGSDGFCFLAEKEEESEMKDTESSPQKEQTEVTNDKTSQNEKHTPKPFFFHSNNTTLRNRLDENFFYRTKSLEELEEEWPEKRTAMKNSFKKRHKDALKLNRKRKGIIAQR